MGVVMLGVSPGPFVLAAAAGQASGRAGQGDQEVGAGAGWREEGGQQRGSVPKSTRRGSRCEQEGEKEGLV